MFRIVIPAKSLPRTPIRGRNAEGWGEGNVVRSKTSRGEGLVPRWGGGGAWQNPPCQSAIPSHNSSFSYLRAPAPAGMSDYYENRPLWRPLVRDSRYPLVITVPHSSLVRK